MYKEYFDYIVIPSGNEKIEVKKPLILEEKKNARNFFTFKSEASNGLKAVFGFRLVSLNKFESEQKSFDLQKAALTWHNTLLKSVQAFSKAVQVNLKYVAENNKVNCFLTFSAFGKNDLELERNLDNLYFETAPLFSINTFDKLQPYIFEEISNEDYLKNSNDLSTYVFQRQPVKIKLKNNVGFNKDDLKITNNNLPPFPLQNDFNNNELLSALLSQENYTEIDIQLTSQTLNHKEAAAIQRVISNPGILNIGSYEEENKYINYVQKFVSEPLKFSVKILLKNKLLNQRLVTSIVHCFFGPDGDNVQLHEYEKYTDLYLSDNLMPFYYDTQNAVQAFHLPFPVSNQLPGLKQQSSVFYQVPENLPLNGILIGEKKINNKNFQIKITEQALSRHLYIMGQTGTGKTTLIKTMIKDMLNKDIGFTIIDPHGDLYDDVVEVIPKEKLITVNPSDENSFGINPLNYNKKLPQAKSLVINELIRIFHSIYDMKVAGGPMFESYFKNGLLLVKDENVEEKFGESNLETMIQIFFKSEYREQLLEVCANEKVIDFFRAAEETSGEQVFANFALYITSKLTRFVEDYYLAPIISGKRQNVDFRKLIDDKKILLVKLEKGLIGSDNAMLLGQMLLSNIILACMARTEQKERVPHFIFIDEFQNFLRSDIGSALSEVRKYGLNMILANQTMGQLNDYLIESLLGNIASMIFFRPGINDYEKIRHYIYPDFEKTDVLKLPNFNCIARLLIDNIPSDPFVFQTIKYGEHL